MQTGATSTWHGKNIHCGQCFGRQNYSCGGTEMQKYPCHFGWPDGKKLAVRFLSYPSFLYPCVYVSIGPSLQVVKHCSHHMIMILCIYVPCMHWSIPLRGDIQRGQSAPVRIRCAYTCVRLLHERPARYLYAATCADHRRRAVLVVNSVLIARVAVWREVGYLAATSVCSISSTMALSTLRSLARPSKPLLPITNHNQEVRW